MRKNIIKIIAGLILISFILFAPIFRWFSGTPNTSIIQAIFDPEINTIEMVVGNIYHNIVER